MHGPMNVKQMIYYTYTYHIFLLQGAYKLQTTTKTRLILPIVILL